MQEKSYKYSEIFYSIQGEGAHTGKGTAWLRMFGCNLNCDGFGQDNPADPSTHELPYKDLEPSDYTKVTELPVFSKGCDSSYSWAKKFGHLVQEGTTLEIANRIRHSMISKHNPKGLFRFGEEDQHMCFTGGEPLLKGSQKCIIDVLQHFLDQGDAPMSVTFETNGTQALTQEFVNFFYDWQMSGRELFFSISPKLHHTSGELPIKAIQEEVVRTYNELSHTGQLKFVVNGTDESWNDLENAKNIFKGAGIDYPIWVMGVGGTVEGLRLTEADIATEAFKRGYYYSTRVHCHIWGNAIGV